jgi:hypothetical protein
MRSSRIAPTPLRARLHRLVLLSLVMAVVLTTVLDGGALPSWVGLGGTTSPDTTLPTGARAPQSEHGVPELAAAAKRKGKGKKKRGKRRHKRHGGSQTPAAPAPAPSQDAVLLAAGDIARCGGRPGDEATAALLDGRAGVVAALGDIAYESGTAQEFADCYDPSWGRHKSRTRATVGNHDYLTPGAAGYFGYFGAAATPLDPNCRSSCGGYYSYDLGNWHIVVLNSNCGKAGGCGTSSPQGQWLRADLAAHPTTCTLAYWHHPRFSFDVGGGGGDTTQVQPLWQALYDAGAEIVLTGHAHNYQRYAPLNATGARDPGRGIRQFVVGTGGANFTPLADTLPPTAEVGNDETFGILQLTLHPTGYNWQFIPEAGQSFTDSGSGACH